MVTNFIEREWLNDLQTRGNNRGQVVLSNDEDYRYVLLRTLPVKLARGDSPRTLAFVMLNPSTADESQDDPTIRRCLAFAGREGFANLTVVNLFAYRATDPKELEAVEDPVGPFNDAIIEKVARQADTVIMAWGDRGAINDRSQTIRKLLWECTDTGPYYLALTKAGEPRHPLYIHGDTKFTADVFREELFDV